jgi:hypothetical protein
MAEPTRSGRGGFGPVALAGVVTAGLAALASSRSWFAGGRELEGAAMPGVPDAGLATTYPAASAVSLVLLAAWGVLLVTRGRVRRGFAVIAVLSAVGLVACVVTAGLAPPDLSQDALGLGGDGETGFTAWFWTSAVVAVAAVVPAVLAVRLAPRWPEMGSRYDAPVGGSASASATAGTSSGEPQGEQELWKQLDAGHDPTRPPVD